jgi:XTP/dITP diphosphohydrolase
MKLILSSRNPSKIQQISALFAGTGIELKTLEQVGIVGEASEDGQTLVDNAELKARYVWEQMPPTDDHWTIADDTGIFIQALGGLPGHRSAHWAGEDATTDQIALHTLEKMKGLKDRRASFMTAVVVISPDKEKHVFMGEVQGVLLEAPKVPPQSKMPYSGLFQPNGTDKVWAEMTVEEENAISHRGKAFTRAIAFLKAAA